MSRAVWFESGRGGLTVQPGALVDHIGLVQAIDRLGQNVVAGVAILPTVASMPASAASSE